MASKIYAELQKFAGDALVELFELDLSILGGSKFYFYSGTNQFSTPIVWQGIQYQPLPIEATGFALNGTGSPARPKLQLSNLNGIFSQLITNMSQLVGAKVTRRRTLGKYLDKENFSGWRGYSVDTANLNYLAYPASIGDSMLGDLTVCYRFKPRSITTRRCNALHKAYGGEFSMTHEIGGVISAYCGSGGGDGGAYLGYVTTQQVAKVNEWNTVVHRRKLGSQGIFEVTINSFLERGTTAVTIVPAKSTAALKVGHGYTAGFDGLIDDVIILNRCITKEETIAYHAGGKFDPSGTIFSASFEKTSTSDQGHVPSLNSKFIYSPTVDSNPESDPNEYFPDEIYYITQKVSENMFQVEFELGSVFDLQGVTVPRRQVIANVCQWRYRGDGCGYTGTTYYDAFDNPASASTDVCGKRLTSCKLRWGTNTLPFGGFIAATLAKQ